MTYSYAGWLHSCTKGKGISLNLKNKGKEAVEING